MVLLQYVSDGNVPSETKTPFFKHFFDAFATCPHPFSCLKYEVIVLLRANVVLLFIF